MAYTAEELYPLAKNAGFTGRALDDVVGIALAESSGNPNARYTTPREDSFGLLQINAKAWGYPMAEASLDPQVAFNNAYKISKGGTDFTPWTTYTSGKYRTGLHSPSGDMPRQGYYQGPGEDKPSLHVNIYGGGTEQPLPAFAVLDSLLQGKQPESVTRQQDPLTLIDGLLGKPQAGAGGTVAAAQPAGDFIEPPGPVPEAPNVLGQAQPLTPTQGMAPAPAPSTTGGFIEPLAKGQTPPPEDPSRSLPTTQIAAPSGGAGAILDALLKGPIAAGQFMAGANKGLLLPGEQLRRELPQMPPASQVGAIPGRMIGNIAVEPIRAGAEALRATMRGEPVAPGEMASAAGAAMMGSIGRGGLGAGPRLPGRIEPPALRSTELPVSSEAPAALPAPAAAEALPVRAAASEAATEISDLWPAAGVQKQAAKGHIREATGQARLSKQLGSIALEKFRGITARDLPNFRDYIEAVHRGESPPKPISMQLIDHIEGVENLPKGSPLLPLANALKKLNSKVRLALSAEFEGFEGIDNYFTHLWERQPIFSGHGMLRARPGGSSYALKKREIPTVGEGIRRGLTPRYLDPIETELRYIGLMSDYLAIRRAERLGEDAGYIQRENPGNLTPLIGVGGPPKYAPPAYAQIWNRFYRPSWFDQHFPDLYHGMLRITNAATSAALTLSGYHGLNIAKETAANALHTAIADLARGRPLRAAGTLARGMTVVPQIMKGKRLQEAAKALDVSEVSPLERQVVDAYVGAGGRVFERGHEYAAANTNFWQEWRRGALGVQFRDDLRQIMGRPDESGMRRALLAMPRASGFIIDQATKAMQSISAPLFDTMIPRVKFAAFSDEMESWLRSNPDAGREEVLAQARSVADSIDDRFGEMVQDNMFWNKEARQTLNLLATSLSWEYGSLRAMAGGAADLARLRLGSSRVRYLAAYVAMVGIAGEVYARLQTGHTVPVGQAFYPPTGGRTPEGKPERAILPGYEKEPFSWMRAFGDAAGAAERMDIPGMLQGMIKGVADEAGSRAGPFWRMLGGLASGKDFQGNRIADMSYDTPAGRMRGIPGYMLQQLEPFAARQQVYKGSAIDMPQRLAGIRPAPIEVQDPQKLDDIKFAQRRKEIITEMSRVSRAGQREGRDVRGELRDLNAILAREQKEYNDRRRARQAPSREPRAAVGGQ